MESNDLSKLWIGNEIKHQRNLKTKLESAYNSLKDQDTDYARGIWKMYKLRCKIIDLLNTYEQ